MRLSKHYRPLLASVFFGLSLPFTGFGQTSFTSNSATGAWNTTRWNNSSDGPAYTSAYTANQNVSFTSGTYTFAGMGTALNVGNITVANNVTVNFASTGSTFATGGNVRTIDVGAGGLFDFNGQAISIATGVGFIKAGPGVLGTGAGNFTGGFTLQAGTVIARGTTGLGSGATNTLTLNGGTLASNGSRDFANTRFGGGIVIGGNVQFGELATNVSIASSSANLSFANNVSLGASTRTLTLGNTGTQTFSGVISNSAGGITFAANPGTTGGRFEITNTSNTFTGNISINGGEVRFTADGSLGNAANDIIIDGGTLSNAASFALGAGRTISVGDGPGTAINVTPSTTVTSNNPISNKTGETGSWAKTGSGTLILGGASDYTGTTTISQGTVQLTTGNNRLPTTTVVSLGQSASSNLGTLDLNGQNQQITGLISIAGNNATASNNTVTSATPATLTLSGTGTYSFGAGTDANSGVIIGAIALVKSGSGTQTLGDANTYTGGTTISAGTLNITNTSGSATGTGTITLTSSGTLSGTGTIVPATNTNISLDGNVIVGDTTLGTAVASFITLNTSGTGVTTTATSTIFQFDLFTRIGSAPNPLGSAADYIRLPGTLNNTSSGSNLGTIVVTNRTGGTTFTKGDSWRLFDFQGTGSISDDFNIDASNLALSPGLIGEFDRFSGTFSIVPEPSRTLFLALGLLTLTLRRRR